MTIAATLADLLAMPAPDAPVLMWRDEAMTAQLLRARVRQVASAMRTQGIAHGDRVAIWLPKGFDFVVALFACATAGAVFIPVNPALKPLQVEHVLGDSGAALLITSAERAASLVEGGIRAARVWTALPDHGGDDDRVACAADDLAAILYTSGSTGAPKGVMLSHRNLCTGSASVIDYLHLTARDRLLCVLPFSFDYGLNQLLTMVQLGGTAVLLDHLFPSDVLKALASYCVTGLAGVPALWTQLAALDWPADATAHLRFITNSGGRMPASVYQALRNRLGSRDIVLMYGLTEAFRSTWLDPSLADRFPDSVGTAIPHAEVRVVHPDGSETQDSEVGELVHMGPLVAQGYWRDAERTAQRFRPAPSCATSVAPGTIAVWSGDKVRRDARGLIHFVGRDDEMIKTSGYRVSPTEVEEALYRCTGVLDAMATSLPDAALGERIVAVVSPQPEHELVPKDVLHACRLLLPSWMMPSEVRIWPILPRNANGKLDRSAIAATLRSEAVA